MQQGRKLQSPTFRYKRRLRQACTDIFDDEVEWASIMHGESSDEHGKPEQSDAVSVDDFGAVVRVGGLAARDGLARSVLRTRHTGTTRGMHARRVQTLQCVHS
jgi:hypothetical protein